MLTDCSQFSLGSRQRQVCEGEAGWTIQRVNVFREMHGIVPLQSLEQGPVLNVGEPTIAIIHTPPQNISGKTVQGCCGGKAHTPGVAAQRMVEGTGVGGRLISIFKSYGFEACEACYDLARRMNEWGPAGCKEKIDEIVMDILPRALDWEAQALGWWKNLLPTKVTSLAIKQIVEGAIETALPLQWEKVGADPTKAKEVKKASRRSREVNNFAGELLLEQQRTLQTAAPLVGIPIDRDKMQSHIIYHVMPLQGETEWVWRRHCAWLREVRKNFNGRMLIGVVTAGKEDLWKYFPPEEVQKELIGLDAEFITAPNEVVRKAERQGRGEGVLFPLLLEKLITDDPNQVAFYGHCKGVTRKGLDTLSPPHLWADVMFETVFRNQANAIADLDTHGITGSFLMRGNFPAGLAGLGPSWFYSGTFFAMRLIDVFRRNWRKLPRHYGCVEQWPRHNFVIDKEAGCLFFNGVTNLYDRSYWDAVVIPAFLEWKAKNKR